MRDLKNKLTSGKNTKNIQARKGKSFGYQVLGFGAGGIVRKFVTASGGTVTTSGDYKIHTFTGPGTFAVSCAGNEDGSTTTDYLVVGGGGGGGRNHAGGGGAGGYRESPGTASGCYSVSPRGASPAVALSVTVQSYPITVGGGGADSTGVCARGSDGVSSVYSSITSKGGGARGS